MCGVRSIWEIPVSFPQFCFEPETSLKNTVLLKVKIEKEEEGKSKTQRLQGIHSSIEQTDK